MRNSRSGLCRGRRDRGAAAIETAACVAAVLLLLFGAIEVSLLASARGSVAFAVEQAARYASLRGAESGAPVNARQIESYIHSQTPSLDPARLRVKTEWLPDNQPGSRVLIRAEYAAPLLLRAGGPSLTLTSSAAVTISQ